MASARRCGIRGSSSPSSATGSSSRSRNGTGGAIERRHARSRASCAGLHRMAPEQLALIGLAGFAAGAVNAIAGGGTLLSFPALLAAGLPAVAANVTSTIALCPGYLGATLAQRADLA